MVNASYIIHCFPSTYIMSHILTGTQNCTINVHLLRHLVHYVRQYGPLWTHSCYPFEGMNGKVLKLHHGTQHISQQVNILRYYACSYKCNYCQQILGLIKAIDRTQMTEAFSDVPEEAKQILLRLNGQENQ